MAFVKVSPNHGYDVRRTSNDERRSKNERGKTRDHRCLCGIAVFGSLGWMDVSSLYQLGARKASMACRNARGAGCSTRLTSEARRLLHR